MADPSSDVVIRGRKVLLRHKRSEDAEDDYRWRADEELAALDAAPPLRISMSEFLRIHAGELHHPFPWVRRYSIDTLEGKHIGNCMFYDIDTVRGEGEVGIMVGEREYWDHGYGVDAMAHLMDECLKMPAIKQLYLHTLEWNGRARRAFAKCGFREVRHVHRSGRDFIRMEITRQEWEELRPSWVNLDQESAEA